jgi:glucose/arabinose dehydrogenase
MAQSGQTITDAASGVRYTVERVMAANYPVALAFAPDGRLFYTEKITGNVRMVSAGGELQPEPVLTLATDALVERGMLGIALDPDYEENGFIWIFHTAVGTSRDYPTNRVVRFHEADGVGSDPQVMWAVPIDNGNVVHNGGNLVFDADGYLFVSMGDYGDPANAQNLDTPQGAIHRFEVTDEGLIPAPDNPFEDSSIYAYGLRNPFDLTIDPVTGRVYATENGPSCDDEVNMILPGWNYGWGLNYVCGETAPDIDQTRYLDPLISITPTRAPTGILFYTHEAVPEWENDLFYCTWTDGALHRVVLNEARTAVAAEYEMNLGDGRCGNDVAVSPDGSLYMTVADENGGRIDRLIPQES